MNPILESAAMTDEPAATTGGESSPQLDPQDDATRMSFGDHLDELRQRLIEALIGIAIASVACLVLGKHILAFIYKPLLVVQHANGLTPNLMALSPTAAFTSYLKIGFLSGLIVAMPWVLHQGWRFVGTGLYEHERRFVRRLAPASVGLFFVGVLFVYYIVLPVVLHFFVSFNRSFPMFDFTPTAFQRLLLPDSEASETSPAKTTTPLNLPVLAEDPPDPADGDTWINENSRRIITKIPQGVFSVGLEPGAVATTVQSQFAIDFYISFVLMLSLAFGIAFETPIVVFFLAWTGLVSTLAMRKARRYVLFAVIVTAAILTPPDVISQMLLAGPMYLLFEVGLVIARLVEKPQPVEAG